MKNILAISAGILAIGAIIPYVLDILTHKTKPNIVSWFTWTLLLAIGTAVAIVSHQTRSAILTGGDLIGTGLTLLLGLKYGIAKFSFFDVACQSGAILGLLFWLGFHSPTIGITTVITIDLVGSLPTLRHSWDNPSEETWQTFAILILAASFTLFSLDDYSFTGLGYPLYILIINVAIVAIVIGRRLKLGVSLKRIGTHDTLHE